MSEGVLAAVRHHPGRRRAIEDLAARDAEFLSVCEDLAAAELALGRWQSSTLAARERRSAEYREIIDSLVREIEAMLVVAPITRHHT